MNGNKLSLENITEVCPACLGGVGDIFDRVRSGRPSANYCSACGGKGIIVSESGQDLLLFLEMFGKND